MGCDGGTIPRRDELVKVQKKPEAKDKNSERAFRWRHCHLTQHTLASGDPVAACGLGRLYSKLALIEALLDKDNIPDNIKHIKSLKDIKTLKLTPNPAYKDENATDGTLDGRGAPYICPIIGLEMAGMFRFVFLWSCGCVFSERALKEIKTKTCHLCMTPFTDEDIVVINGNDEDVAILKTRLESRRAAVKVKKKKEPVKTETVSSPAVESPAPCSSSTEPKSDSEVVKKEPEEKKEEIETIPLMLPRPTGLNSLMRPHKRRAPENVLQDPVYKKTKDDYSVAKDPKATDVYKSIFTSHHSEKTQERAHWITYNPFFN